MRRITAGLRKAVQAVLLCPLLAYRHRDRRCTAFRALGNRSAGNPARRLFRQDGNGATLNCLLIVWAQRSVELYLQRFKQDLPARVHDVAYAQPPELEPTMTIEGRGVLKGSRHRGTDSSVCRLRSKVFCCASNAMRHRQSPPAPVSGPRPSADSATEPHQCSTLCGGEPAAIGGRCRVQRPAEVLPQRRRRL
jgi:hypothetical protein